MDVDDLGQAFVAGFENKDGASAADRRHYVTISRTAALSTESSRVALSEKSTFSMLNLR